MSRTPYQSCARYWGSDGTLCSIPDPLHRPEDIPSPPNREREAYDAGRLAGFEEGLAAASATDAGLREAWEAGVAACIDHGHFLTYEDAVYPGDAAPAPDAGLRAAELDEGRLGLALHRIYCQQNAPMHSEPHHSAKRIAAEYAALS
jgi:hypothetical protein